MSLNYKYNKMVEEKKQKIEGLTENKYICTIIQITDQKEYCDIFFSA